MDEVERAAGEIVAALRPRIRALVERNEALIRQLQPLANGRGHDAAIRAELTRWRDNARKRLRRGLPPKRFESPVLSDATAATVWRSLWRASTPADIDAAFRPVRREGWRKDARGARLQSAEAHYAPIIHKHLYRGLDAQQIATGWASKAPKRLERAVAIVPPDDYADEVRSAAQDYASSLNLGDSSALSDTLLDLYGNAYTVGGSAAVDRVVSLKGSDGLDSFDQVLRAINWSVWQPGDPQLAQQLAGLNGGRGLPALLDSAGVTIQGIDVTTIGDIGTTLAMGALAGDSTLDIAGSLMQYFGDPSRSEMVARTELSRGAIVAQHDAYTAAEATSFDWLTGDNPCDDCQAMADANPHPMDAETPPIHPNDACDTAPNFDTADNTEG